MKKTLAILAVAAIGATASGQADRSQMRDGNRSYNNGKYDKAEVLYRRALEADTTDFKGHYNLGNALYRQKKYTEAASHYDQALQSPGIGDDQRARALHNRGNSHLKAGMEDKANGMQHFQQAVQSYQDALKIDPKNDDTRYNLAYAQRLLQQAQQQQQNQQQNQQGNQNQQNQQGKQQDQQDQQQDQQQNQQNQQGDKGKEERQNQKQQNAMEQRRQDAERMLEAVKNNERQSLKDQQKKVQGASVKHRDKDW